MVRRGYAAINAADIGALLEIFDADASWHTPGQTSIGGDRVGRDAVLAQFGRYGGETGGTFKATLREVFPGADGRVVAMHHNGGERNGKRLDVECYLVFQVENGRLVSGTESSYDLHAWEDFWS